MAVHGPADVQHSVTAGGRGRKERGNGERAMVPKATPTSYYGHPVIKQPVWKWEIGAYFYTGGLAGGSMMLAAASRRQGNHTVARRALFTAMAGIAVSTALLIRDLGVPSRFLNMLRVFKVTSPMSVGTWILSAAGTLTGIATGCEVLGILPRVRDASETAAAAFGAPLTTYTAALIADTAVPLWHDAAIELPVVFACTSLATAGAASIMFNDPKRSATARTLAIGGSAGALVSVEVMERRLGAIAEPYHRQRAGMAAKALIAGGAALTAVCGRRRPFAVVGGAAILAGGMLERWSVYTAGSASAADPKYTVGPQIERRERAQLGEAGDGSG